MKYIQNIRNPIRDLTQENISAGLLAAIFGCVATSLIIINSGAQAGLTDGQIVSWLFSCWFFGGSIGVYLAWTTGQPISGAWSIPAAVMLGGTLGYFTFEEAVGAYFMAGVLVFLLGITGLVNRLIRLIPMPIIMAMIAGALMRFATGIMTGVSDLPLIAGATVVTYFISLATFRRVTPIIPALVVGLSLFYLFGEAVPVATTAAQFQLPGIYMPSFSIEAFIAISLPVAILVIGAENAQAAGVLMSEGYKPPVSTMTVISGLGAMVACFFGAHNANIAGPMTAICSSDVAGHQKEKRYVASIICGVICLVFGIFSSYAISFIKLIPLALIATVAGLAMINVLLQSLQMAFNPSKKASFQLGAFTAFVVALSGVSFLNITAPFWALVAGLVVTLVTEKQQFKELLAPQVE